MKKLAFSLAIMVCLMAGTQAGPLQKSQVPADAKWLLHVDLNNFKTTQLGQFVTRELVEKNWSMPKAHIKQFLDLDLDWSQFESLTAYGTDFQVKPDAAGVLLVKLDKKLFESLNAKLERMIQMAPDGGGFISQVKDAPKGTYTVNNELFVTLPKDGLLVLSKTRNLVDKANEVISGKASSLRANQAFSDFATVPNAFFFLAVAEGFSGKANLPPQAQVLQQADGGRLVLGEKSDNLYLNLALRAKTAEVSQQIQQVVQGLLALVSISQQQQPELVQLVQNTKVTNTDKVVSLAIEYPVAKVIEKIGLVANKEKSRLDKPAGKKTHAEHAENEEEPAKDK